MFVLASVPRKQIVITGRSGGTEGEVEGAISMGREGRLTGSPVFNTPLQSIIIKRRKTGREPRNHYTFHRRLNATDSFPLAACNWLRRNQFHFMLLASHPPLCFSGPTRSFSGRFLSRAQSYTLTHRHTHTHTRVALLDVKDTDTDAESMLYLTCKDH